MKKIADIANVPDKDEMLLNDKSKLTAFEMATLLDLFERNVSKIKTIGNPKQKHAQIMFLRNAKTCIKIASTYLDEFDTYLIDNNL
jgi:hypothetical protein